MGFIFERMPHYELLSLVLLHVINGYAFNMGFLMCEDKCLHIKGCSVFQYIDVQLSCHLDVKEPLMTLQESVFTANLKTKSSRRICNFNGCKNGSRYLTNRARKGVCVSESGVTLTTKRLENKVPLLFIIPKFGSRKTSIQQFNPLTKQLEDYKYLMLKKVSAISSMVKTRSLLIAHMSPNNLFSFQLDTKKQTQIKTGIFIREMVADEVNQLVFCLGRRTSKEVIRISITTGSEIRFPLKFYKQTSTAIAIDSSKNVLYAPCNNVILICDYYGKSMSVFCTGYRLYSIYFSPQTRVLYYSSNTDIIWKSTETGSGNKTSMASKPMLLVYYEHHIYASSSITPGKLHIYDVSSHSWSDISIRRVSDGLVPLFCIIH